MRIPVYINIDFYFYFLRSHCIVNTKANFFGIIIRKLQSISSEQKYFKLGTAYVIAIEYYLNK